MNLNLWSWTYSPTWFHISIQGFLWQAKHLVKLVAHILLSSQSTRSCLNFTTLQHKSYIVPQIFCKRMITLLNLTLQILLESSMTEIYLKWILLWLLKLIMPSDRHQDQIHPSTGGFTKNANALEYTRDVLIVELQKQTMVQELSVDACLLTFQIQFLI